MTDPRSGVWPAPRAHRQLDAVVAVPGSKSLTNRYLVLAALADSPTTLRSPLHSRDSFLMIEALRALGVTIVELPGGDLEITPPSRPGGASVLEGETKVDCGLAGTVMRFVPPLAALADGPVTFDGDPRARERPMGGIIDALRRLGLAVDDDGRGTLPFTVRGAADGAGGVTRTDGAGGGPAIRGGSVEVDASASSQFVSALLLVAPRLPDGLEVRHVGDRLPSQPHIDMTITVLRERGVDARELAPGHWRVAPGPIAGGEVRVEPDLSNAGPFLAAALVAGGTVRVPHWPATTTQPGDDLREILGLMGGEVDHEADGTLRVTGTGVVTGVDLDLTRAGELAPTVAALATVADGPSRLTGIAHLRGHETDRLAALVTEITRLGGVAAELPDGVAIAPGALHGADVESYHDHRMATFGAIVGLAVDGVGVVDVATTAKTMPDFPAMWTAMVASGAEAP
ncbi:3-phosphoshikimate 1-carboxyvinyltransferase [Salana multivorans]|uniref:3-phosphoshikimate 1-carboxyvinyltransferase n=1 Tax=Salana multivorans TaxID=120377 RepID=A0A3N2D7E9_9MICO|nr:3-phosphoshikimate 1-carboxyvinyltransferase [Salana multivorans]ROR95701.1 3-phosphoshikimate 1-carboxyvinyltransferase [Salana multivorans]